MWTGVRGCVLVCVPLWIYVIHQYSQYWCVQACGSVNMCVSVGIRCLQECKCAWIWVCTWVCILWNFECVSVSGFMGVWRCDCECFAYEQLYCVSGCTWVFMFIESASDQCVSWNMYFYGGSASRIVKFLCHVLCFSCIQKGEPGGTAILQLFTAQCEVNRVHWWPYQEGRWECGGRGVSERYSATKREREIGGTRREGCVCVKPSSK